MELEKLKSATQKISVKYGDDITVDLTIRIFDRTDVEKIAQALDKDMERLNEKLESMKDEFSPELVDEVKVIGQRIQDAQIEIFCAKIASWNLVSGGSPVPVTPEGFAQLIEAGIDHQTFFRNIKEAIDEAIHAKK